MANKKKSKSGNKASKSLVQVPVQMKLSSEAILSHPVFRDMATRLETIQGVLRDLPRVIGEAVAEATRKPPEGASGPAMPLVHHENVEMGPGKLSLDGKTFLVGPQEGREAPRVIEKGSAQ